MSSRLVILPKKSWNVWSPANVARVRRDEEAASRARAEEKGTEMKEKIKKMKNGMKAHDDDDTIYDSRGHVNLFRREELAEAARTGGLTEEEARRRDEKERREKRKLGTFAARVPLRQPQHEKPWFAKSKKRSFEEMRERRLERERHEAKRAARLRDNDNNTVLPARK